MAGLMSSLSPSPDLAAEAPGHVLFVDDDADVLKAAALLLGRRGLRVSGARDPAQARSLLAADPADVILLDLNFARGATSGEEGFACLRTLLEDDPQAVVVVVTGHSGVSVAVRAMRAGASDFVMKPWNNARLLSTVEGALELRRRKASALAAPSGEVREEAVLLGDSPAMERVRALVARAAPTLAPVLVTGGPGTGKSLVARRLHLASPHRDGPFIVADLTGLSREDGERLLFGDGRPGAVASAWGGTLVLDEVGDLAPALQGRLLSTLEQGGAGAARIVAASRRSRAALQGRGGLREALLYRLDTVAIALPPLAERGRDVLLLAEHYLHLFARRYDKPLRALSPAAADRLLAAPWPGGVRALRQTLERGVLFAEGPSLEAGDLALEDAVPSAAEAAPQPSASLLQSERTLVAAALKRHGFNVSHAARDLGITRAALYRRMSKHGL